MCRCLHEERFMLHTRNGQMVFSTHCFSEEGRIYGRSIGCSDARFSSSYYTVASTAYGVYLVYIGGIVTLSTGGTAAATTVPAAAVGAVMGLAGGYGIKRYCIDLVSNGIESVSREQVHYGAMRKSQEP